MKKAIIFGIVTILAMVAAFAYMPRTSDKHVTQTTEPAVQEAKATKTLALAEGVADPEPATEKLGGITRYLEVKGQVASVQLVVIASVGGAPLGEYDNLYLKIGDGQAEAGGHFDESPIDLRAAHTYNLAQSQAQVTDFMALLNGGRSVRIDLFVSSARGNRSIDKAYLTYTCEGDCEIAVK